MQKTFFQFCLTLGISAISGLAANAQVPTPAADAPKSVITRPVAIEEPTQSPSDVNKAKPKPEAKPEVAPIIDIGPATGIEPAPAPAPAVMMPAETYSAPCPTCGCAPAATAAPVVTVATPTTAPCTKYTRHRLFRRSR